MIDVQAYYFSTEGICEMVHAENLLFSYNGSAPYVLNGIEMHIARGEYVSVMGENGCGKSTLMRLLLQFMKPLSGRISCAATRIGYVPQRKDFSNSDFPIAVSEMLHSYRNLLHIKGKEAVMQQLQLVGMENCAGALMGTLSSGQSQKILIARALMGNPDMLILDEPSTGVDIPSQREIYAFLKKLNQEQKITILSVEHNLEAAISNSTKIYHLAGGGGHLCTPQQYVEEFLQIKETGHGTA